jgi:N-acyl homoserine lactone hydrolase
MPSVTLLHAGALTVPAGLFRTDDPMDEQRRMPVPVYLIETDTERILVDTGLHPDAIADPVSYYGAGPAEAFGFSQDQSIADHLDLTTLTRVVLTHVHFDHAGGLALLPADIPIVVQRREWEAAQDPEAVARNFFYARDYDHVDPDRLILVDGDHDLLGDGSIRLLLTPGHTPGHQSVQVGERVIIGGDVAHFVTALQDERLPMFADDHEAQIASVRRLRALRDAGATVLPGHDENVLIPGPIAA